MIRSVVGDRRSFRSRRGARCVSRAVGAVEALESRTLLAVTINGDIRVPGEPDSLSFNYATPKRLYFDSLTNDSAMRWSLRGPTGTLVSNRPFNSSDGVSISSPILSVPAGSYQVDV